MPEETIYYTVKEAAEKLGVHTRVVYRAVAFGELRHYRVGLGSGFIRLTQKQLDDYVEFRDWLEESKKNENRHF